MRANLPCSKLIAGALAVVGVPALFVGCESAGPAQEREERRQLTMEMFRELVEQGTLTPVDSMEDAFEGIEPDMGATPEDRGGPVPQAEPPAPVPEQPVVEPPSPTEPAPAGGNPYLEFGSRIKVYPDLGLIMKPYPVRPGMGKKLLELITDYADIHLYDPATGPQGPATVRVDLREDFDTEVLSPAIRVPAPADGKEVKLADWLIVTASPANLREVEYFIDIFAAGPPQIEIEAKIVEWVTRDSFDWGITNLLDSTGKALPMVDLPDNAAFDALSWSLPNRSGNNQFLAGFSAIHDGATYSALLETLATFENVSIISRPKVAVREGWRANIQAIQKIPFLNISSISGSGTQNASIAFQEVGVKLFVTPRLVGTNTVSLEIDIEASQQTGNQTTSVVGGDPISTPVLATRTANTVVYLKPRQAVIIGGLITERSVEEERKIPLLGDIPVLGWLFKSTYTATEKAQVLFFIRPRVLEGTDFTREY